MSLIISVIIPAFNSASFLSQTLNSVLSQISSRFQLDVVVVDDGSTDETEKICLSYGARLRYFRQPHCGFPGTVRNYGLQQARGELVAFLDADDFWLPGSLERRVEVLESRPDVGFIYANYFLLQGKEQSLGCVGEDSPSGAIFDRLFRGTIVLNTDTVLVRRQLVNDIGGFLHDRRTAEDYWLWLQLAKRASAAYVRDPVAVTRVRAGSISRIPALEKLPNLIRILESISRQFQVSSSLASERLNPLRIWLTKELFRDGQYWHALLVFASALWEEPERTLQALWEFTKKRAHGRRFREPIPVR